METKATGVSVETEGMVETRRAKGIQMWREIEEAVGAKMYANEARGEHRQAGVGTIVTTMTWATAGM